MYRLASCYRPDRVTFQFFRLEQLARTAESARGQVKLQLPHLLNTIQCNYAHRAIANHNYSGFANPAEALGGKHSEAWRLRVFGRSCEIAVFLGLGRSCWLAVVFGRTRGSLWMVLGILVSVLGSLGAVLGDLGWSGAVLGTF